MGWISQVWGIIKAIPGVLKAIKALSEAIRIFKEMAKIKKAKDAVNETVGTRDQRAEEGAIGSGSGVALPVDPSSDNDPNGLQERDPKKR